MIRVIPAKGYKDTWWRSRLKPGLFFGHPASHSNMLKNTYLIKPLDVIMMKRSTIQLLRFPFSFFLMPVFWFAVSWVPHADISNAAIVFFILHILVYPSSNGYNSYMDRDTDSIGGIEHPMQPEKELFYITIFIDLAAVGISLLISVFFAALLACYIVFSRLYSYRGIRLKKYPVIGYLTVMLNQGGLVFLMVYHGVSAIPLDGWPWQGMAAACFLIGGFYPITQVYQHRSDAKDGVRTLSMLLGVRGTFVFCAVLYLIAFGILFFYYRQHEQLRLFLVLQLFFLPVLLYFFKWVIKVWRDETAADFKHTMQMNWLASSFTNLGFITLLIIDRLG